MKKILLLICIANSLMGIAQKNYEISDTIFRIPQLTYFGIDFCRVKFVKIRPDDEVLLKDGILARINKAYAVDQAPGLRDKLDKTITFDSSVINSLNSKFEGSGLSGDNDTIEKILKGYKCSPEKGIGLVFMVSNLDKMKYVADLYPVFFDIKTRKIIWKCLEFSGAHKESAMGPGSPLPYNSNPDQRLNNYWYTKVSKAIDSFLIEYNDQYKEMKYKDAYEKRIGGRKSTGLNGLYLRVILNELGIGYQWRGAPKNTFMIEIGYRMRFSNSWSYVGSPIPVEYLARPFCYEGPSVKMTLKYDVSKHSSIAGAIGYQHLYCPEVTYDPEGYGGSGSPDAIYQVYSGTNDEFLLQLLHYIRFGRNPYAPVSFFYGIGFKICSIKERFSIDGNEENHKPSTSTTIDGKIQPLVTFGLAIRIIRIPH